MFSKSVFAGVITALLLAACTAPAQGPTTWLDRPLDGDQVALEMVTIQAHASDASGIGEFEIFINDSLLSSPAGGGSRFSQTTVEWVPPAAGTYVVRARSVNAAGAVGSEAKAVIVVGSMTPTPAKTATHVSPPQPVVTQTVFIIEPEPLPVRGITVTPVPVPTCPGVPIISSFAANPRTITAGGTSTLTWGPITNADSALIDHGIGGPTLSGSSFPVSPNSTTTYELSATGCGGTVVQSVTVTVLPPAPVVTITPVPVCPGPPVIASFAANPSSITAGQSSTLSWGAVTNATSAWIDPGIGGVGTPGSTRVNPGGTTTYTLSATGCGGTVRRQVTVAVNPAPPPPGITLVPLPLPIITVPKPPADTTAPSISGVSVNPTNVSRSGCGRTTTATVSARVTDAGGVSRVVLRLGGVGGGEYDMGAAGGDAYSATVGPFGSLGQVAVQIVAWDKAGNSSQAGGPTINVICIQ